MLWKLFGGCMMVLAGWMAGSRAAGRFDRHMFRLRQILNMLHQMESSLRRREELPRAMKEAVKKANIPIHHIQWEEEPSADYWKQNLAEVPELDAEDLRELSSGLERLFRGDRKLREGELIQMEQYLNEKIDRLRKDASSCGRLYRNLGVLLSLAAAIMLI